MAGVSVSIPHREQVAAAPNAGSMLIQFLIRRRVAISFCLFTAMAVEDILDGVKPHDVLNFRDVHTLLGMGLMLAGLGLRSWAAGTLRKGEVLATTGPYSVIRNPLYVGSFLMMFGFCAIIDDQENIWFMLGPVLGMYLLRIHDEEKGLATRFGDAWTKYVRQTPRIFPRRLWPRFSAEWRIAQWTRNREYRAVITTLVALVAIKVWRGF